MALTTAQSSPLPFDNNNAEDKADRKPSFYTDINKNRLNGLSEYSASSQIYRIGDYYFIRDGDFDIVWRNVYIFVIGHILYAGGLYILWSEQLLKTWIYCKFNVSVSLRTPTGQFLMTLCMSQACF
jgi:hypothetical protein